MKRTDNITGRERMSYQIVGFLAFPLVNVPLGALLWMISKRTDTQLPTLVLALPWLVNGIIMVLAFLLRPDFALGYMAFIAVAVSVVTTLSVLFVAACFVSVLSAVVIGPLAIGLFVILMAAGVYVLALLAMHVYRSWRSSYKNNSQ